MLLHKIAFILYLRLGFYFFQIFRTFLQRFVLYFWPRAKTSLKFGRVEFSNFELWIFAVVFFRQAHLKKSKQIFDILNSTCPNWWATKDKRYHLFRISFVWIWIVQFSGLSKIARFYDRLFRSKESNNFVPLHFDWYDFCQT